MADRGAQQQKEDEQERRLPLAAAQVWSWGAGTGGQLASGAFADRLQPLQVNWVGGDGLQSGTRVAHMAGGGAHAVAVLAFEGGEDEVVTWGNGRSGALGHGDDLNLSVPKVVKAFQASIDICSVAAGWSHTAFVARSGQLYTCGDGSFGQLGHGTLEARSIPCEVMALPRDSVALAACGMRHTLVLTHGSGSGEGQTVYAFGSSKRGQLGTTTMCLPNEGRNRATHQWKVAVPQKTARLPDRGIVLLAANGDHSAALDDAGGLYLWGRGFSGSPNVPLPTRVESQLKFSRVALGWNHCIAHADGRLWAWGSNRHGQLGLSEAKPSTRVNEFSKDALIEMTSTVGTSETVECESQARATGAHTSSQHDERWNAPESVIGRRYCGRTVPSPSAASTDGPQRERVSHAEGRLRETHAGLEICCVGGLDGKVVTWVSAGAEHSAIALEDGRIMTWGWGEHGQLGLGTDMDQPVPKAVKFPPPFLEGKPRSRTCCGSGFTLAVAEQEREDVNVTDLSKVDRETTRVPRKAAKDRVGFQGLHKSEWISVDGHMTDVATFGLGDVICITTSQGRGMLHFNCSNQNLSLLPDYPMESSDWLKFHLKLVEPSFTVDL